MSQPQQDYQEIHHQYLVVRRLANIFKEQKKKTKNKNRNHQQRTLCSAELAFKSRGMKTSSEKSEEFITHKQSQAVRNA